MPITRAIVFFLALAASAPAYATDSTTQPAYRELYVSPNGADTGPGTRDQPLATLAGARDAVRKLNAGMTGDIVVNLRGGIYPTTAPVEFGVTDSGKNGFNVIYRAIENEVPVLSGGEPVTGWSLDHGKVWKATLNRSEKLRSLYVNGTRAQMTKAGYTGQGPWGEFDIKGDEPWADTPGKTLDGIQFDAAQVPVFTNPEDVELLQSRVWNFLVLGVHDMKTEGDKTVVQLQQPYGAIAATMAWKCNLQPTGKFTLRNAYELLKKPGEFYFNSKTHTLYYIPRDGEDMTKAEVIAPMSEGLLSITGESTTNRVHNLVFSGLTFSYDHWLLEKVGDSRGMAGAQSTALYTRFRADGDWHPTHYNICDLPLGSVEVRSAQNIQFERNHFVHLSTGSGISLVNDVVDSQITGNVFNDISGNAINIGHPQHYIIGDGPLYKNGVEGFCANIKVTNNWIRKVSFEFKQEEAISGYTTQGVEILHNDIQGVPYGGIALGWGWGNSKIPASTVPLNNTIAYNRVVETQTDLPGDGGAIYVLGEQHGGHIDHNYVDSVGSNLYPDDASAYWEITENVLHPRPGKGTNRHNNCWLFLWGKQMHDMKIDNNYTSGGTELNKGTNTTATNTHIENPYSPEAQKIIDAAGLEPAYKDIAEGEKQPN